MLHRGDLVVELHCTTEWSRQACQGTGNVECAVGKLSLVLAWFDLDIPIRRGSLHAIRQAECVHSQEAESWCFCDDNEHRVGTNQGW